MDKTILLVDDLQMFLEIEKDFFKYSQVELLTAKDGVEALKSIKNKKPDFIFMDLQMPNMDGITCCRTIKADPDLRSVPVAIVTSSAGTQERNDCLAAGCDYFLTKPARRDHFLEVARKHLPEVDRREKRNRCSYTCTIHHQDNVTECSLHDLSSDGAFVVTEYSIKLPTTLQIGFTLSSGVRIECHAKPIWINESYSKHPKGFGVKFALMSKEDKAILLRFVDNVL